MTDAQLFAFEDDFVASLRCSPMAVRLKLDRVAIKLTLRQWSRFTREDRQALLEAPCRTPAEIEACRVRLIALVAQRAGEAARPLAEPPAPLWERSEVVAPAVVAFAAEAGVSPPSPGQWRALSELQRFALIKLSRDNHDNANFVPAMREFGLASATSSHRAA